ncbi:hypothetical protein MKW98_010036 [Papaver atlanticum]|uniref:Uncharacterized protein n=1 Tax=Papaver atlanticum TaxID=357466 RepID=A0AAD4X595_9MAGN|nr:hypothetical protein MKW98_010036 [Papaver atlanticum]
MNITIRRLNLEQLQDFDDIRGYVYHMGEIIAFDPPRLIENETYAMTVRLTMNVFSILRAHTLADDGRGGILVDIYQASSTASPDSPLVRPDSVPIDI